MAVDQFVATLRTEAGLSQRALANRAGCTRSTIARIESGQMEPTVAMLARIAAATGRRLSFTADGFAKSGSLAAIANSASATTPVPWRPLRGLIDSVHKHPERAQKAISDPPPRTGSDRLDNLLAAIAEKLADDASLRRPTWTHAVPPLMEEWQAPGTPRMRAAEAAAAAPQFVKRRILLGAFNLWRVGG